MSDRAEELAGGGMDVADDAVVDMPPMPLVMGSMMSGDRKTALGTDAVANLGAMGTVVFGLGAANLNSLA
jgi:hypothetical protein